MAEENRESRRYPQNLQGLLQLAVDAGSASDGPAPVEPMSEEVNSQFTQIHGSESPSVDTLACLCDYHLNENLYNCFVLFF